MSRLIVNVEGPISTRKRLLMEAMQSVLLYGAEVGVDAFDKEVHLGALLKCGDGELYE